MLNLISRTLKPSQSKSQQPQPQQTQQAQQQQSIPSPAPVKATGPATSLERDGGAVQKPTKDESGQIGGVGVVIQETKSNDMEIIQIVPGGPAHLSGVVRVGDIVESVDGLFVSGACSLMKGTVFSNNSWLVQA